MTTDPRDVLETLARELDVATVMARHPGLERSDLQRIIREAADRLPASGPKTAALVVYIDGAARGNPGEAGAGAVFFDPEGTVLEKQSLYLGRATNNTAEYRALLLALGRARELGAKRLQVYSDSELLVNQINGRYRTRVAHLQEYCQEAIRLMKGFSRVNVSHVPRERNRIADELANQAIDRSGAG